MAIIGNQYVLRLEIPVVNSYGMAELHSVQDLEEGMLGKPVVPDKASTLSDVAKQIAFRAVLEHDKGAVGAVQDAHQGDHIGMLAGLVVHRNLSSLEALLSGIQSMFGERLDGVQFVGVNVDGLVDNPIGTNSENGDELKPIGQNTPESIFRRKACWKLW